MELRHFRYALAVAEEGSFTRAAERLHVAQQGLSQQIAELERELGVRLFERLPRGVHVTSAGEAFLRHARAILAESATAMAEARGTGLGHRGHLRLGVPAVGTSAADALVAEFRAGHPGVEIELDQLHSREYPAALQTGRLDVGLDFTPAGLANIDEEVVATALMPWVFVPDDHPLAGRDQVWLRELESTPMLSVSRESNPYLHGLLLAQLAQRGVHPRPSELVVNSGLSVSHVAIARAWLPWFQGTDPAPRTARCRIADPPLALDLWLLYRRDTPSALAEQFIASCRASGGGLTAPPLAG